MIAFKLVTFHQRLLVFPYSRGELKFQTLLFVDHYFTISLILHFFFSLLSNQICIIYFLFILLGCIIITFNFLSREHYVCIRGYRFSCVYFVLVCLYIFKYVTILPVNGKDKNDCFKQVMFVGTPCIWPSILKCIAQHLRKLSICHVDLCLGTYCYYIIGECLFKLHGFTIIHAPETQNKINQKQKTNRPT